MRMYKSFKFKLLRNKKRQKRLTNELFIFWQIYNHCIRVIKKHYLLFGKNPKKNDLQKHLKRLIDRELKPEWEVLGYSQGIQEVTDRIYKSYNAFFKWAKTKKAPSKLPPRIKSFKNYKSFTLKQSCWKVNESQKKIKIGDYSYKYHQSRLIFGNPKSLTVKRDSLGDWYIFILCEINDTSTTKKKLNKKKSVGYDFGLKIFLTSSDNEVIKSPEFLSKSIKIIKKQNKILSRKINNSKNKKKSLLYLIRVHKKIRNKRLDFHFKQSLKILKEYDYIFFEDLDLNKIKKRWGRKTSDLGFFNFLRIIEFKANELGKIFKKIDRFFPSSKICSKCSFVKNNMPLNERVFKCICGNIIDRDLNASINIKNQGLTLI